MHSIKDKDNLLTFNQWTGTDYSNNTSDWIGFTNGQIVSSNEWSSNHEKSLKFTQSTPTAWSGCDARVYINGGQTVEFTVDILTNCQLSVGLYQLEPNPHNLTNVNVPGNNQKTTVTLSYELPEDLTRLSLRFLQQYGSLDNKTYLDNLTLKII